MPVWEVQDGQAGLKATWASEQKYSEISSKNWWKHYEFSYLSPIFLINPFDFSDIASADRQSWEDEQEQGSRKQEQDYL